MRRVGILSFFPAFFPPTSGGELRLHHLARALAARGHQVRMAAPTYGHHPRETVAHAPGFEEIRLPKTAIYGRLHRLMDVAAGFRECSGLVCSLAAAWHPELRLEAERLAATSDVYTQESPFLAPLIPRHRPRGQLLVYNSYNVEARMAAGMFGRTPQGLWATRRIHRLEGALAREADLVLACSDEDAAGFRMLFGVPASRIEVIPNGVDVEAMRPPAPGDRAAARALLGAAPGRPVAFFIGSHHPPNIEAVDLIARRLAPRLGGVDFLVAGRVCDNFTAASLPPNVRLLGLVDEPTKMALFHGADVALNPMLSGGGTNLKMLDYLACGLAVLSTPFGARGLGLVDGVQVCLAEPAAMAEALEALLDDAPRRAALGIAARAHAVAHFSWRRIGDRIADLYTWRSGRRIVFLSDYPIHPPRHGGQARVATMARVVADGGWRVTHVALAREGGPATRPGPGIEQFTIARGRWHRLLDAVLARLAGAPADDVSAGLAARWLTPSFGRVARQELARADAVVLVQPYLWPQLRAMGCPLPPVLLDAQNNEAALRRTLFRRWPVGPLLARWVAATERAAVRGATRILAATPAVAESLAAATSRRPAHFLAVGNTPGLPAGAPLPADDRPTRRAVLGLSTGPVAVFLGSGHPPNQIAARLIAGPLAAALPGIQFVLIGECALGLPPAPPPANVVVLGPVEDSVRAAVLDAADIGLNPLAEGGGSSVKLIDYLGAGLWVVATPVGARGYDVAPPTVTVVEEDHLAAAVQATLDRRAATPSAAELAASEARRLGDPATCMAELPAALRRFAAATSR